MDSSQSSSAKVALSMASRTQSGCEYHRSRLSFSPPWLAVDTRQTPSASSSMSWGGPQGVCIVVIGRVLPSCKWRAGPPPKETTPLNSLVPTCRAD